MIMVSPSWTLLCLKMYKILDQFVQFIKKTIETRRVEQTAGGKNSVEVKTERAIS